MPKVVTFGEAMVRLSPPGFARLEQANSLDIHVGGAELNTAAGLCRMGTPAGWVSALPDNPLGRLICNKGRELGVDMSGVRTTDGRAGVYFVEFGASPRAGSVLYDRADSAFARVRTGQFDWAKLFAGAELFHTGGIAAAVSDSAAEVVSEALTAARKSGLKVGFDVNYRSKLWSVEKAGRVIRALSDRIDYLFTDEHTGRSIHGVEGRTAEEVARRLIERYGFSVVVMTRREELGVWRNRWSAVAYDARHEYATRTYDLEIVDRVGAGDSFAAGFLHGLLTGNVQKALDWGTALSALKHTIPGDFNYSTASEVEALLAGGSLRIAR